MRRAGIYTLGLVMLAGCGALPAYKQPPADSYSINTVQVKIGDVATTVKAASVTREFFAGAEVRPLVGRFFNDGESGTPVVVVNYDFWTKRLGATRAMVGAKIDINGRAVTLVGIAPRDFAIPDGTLLWIPR